MVIRSNPMSLELGLLRYRPFTGPQECSSGVCASCDYCGSPHFMIEVITERKRVFGRIEREAGIIYNYFTGNYIYYHYIIVIHMFQHF